MTTPNIQQLALAKVDETRLDFCIHRVNSDENGCLPEFPDASCEICAIFFALRSAIVRHEAYDFFGDLMCINCKWNDGDAMPFPCPELQEIAKELGIK